MVVKPQLPKQWTAAENCVQFTHLHIYRGRAGIQSESPEPSSRRQIHSEYWRRVFHRVQLTSVCEISEEQWQRRLSDRRRKSGTYNVMVLKDTDTKQLRVTASYTMCEGLMLYCADYWRYKSCSSARRGRQLHGDQVLDKYPFAFKIHKLYIPWK